VTLESKGRDMTITWLFEALLTLAGAVVVVGTVGVLLCVGVAARAASMVAQSPNLGMAQSPNLGMLDLNNRSPSRIARLEPVARPQRRSNHETARHGEVSLGSRT
jgi:hypothetical protein